jgi:SpoVK/Ycf46/Vps4 family AAA+-type ATPase
MTSNDISKLPPELTRSGRLDAKWFFGIPSESERKDILKIHLNLTNKDYDEKIIDKLAKETKDYTGAEIKEIVKQSVWKAFKRLKQDNNNAIIFEDISSCIKNVIPIATSSKEQVSYLENWARTRARFSNEVIDETGYNINKDNDLLKKVLNLDL